MTGQIKNCWEQDQPYSAMLKKYERAAEAAKARRTELADQLRALLHQKEGTLRSATRQKELEKRIMTLRDEYDDLTDAIREIRIYADRECN